MFGKLVYGIEYEGGGRGMELLKRGRGGILLDIDGVGEEKGNVME
ncbi:hypothetical protein [Cytobacillus oceanisediminis]|nr:hypothetical protein [Cytobacillus oceanisediminis]